MAGFYLIANDRSTAEKSVCSADVETQIATIWVYRRLYRKIKALPGKV